MGCMASGCALLCPEDFILKVLSDRTDLRTKYEEFVFKDLVTSHPHLRFCPGRDCCMIVMAKSRKAKKVTCIRCQTSFCVLCGSDYHAPTSCETIRMWLIKCADDSETANYISAHTKDCPNCHSCIEKNGGCNHMQCAKCKHHFCWMCFGDWKTHGSEYYECSRYKENPSVAQEANHKVNGHEGTWIDWQHLHRATTLLTKCRYTLQGDKYRLIFSLLVISEHVIGIISTIFRSMRM
uniref:RBR-type E3 ubiquitin transferase n=1 Tax=Parascaris equorum TaxID=6256 RepID=A0A914RY00_PAREQ